ncbi:AraC-like DNA-binding protein [Catalinimonas alkaloidigena]|uniref:helix-turn-helix domain-containing protein n=1 Tax=Catalinimonas alkaloidigena TaxID=1075417 RepID=UPI002405AC20|nr:AraC family transcriptional regulator [Catalinimonas alkaloidigena]MDF9800128.1 AraC-like DNA-binding protein [Catalinimonas alkaloidigena]
MINVYEYFKNHPTFNKLVGNDFLFVEYKCPINIEEYQLWIESHLITFVISGKKDWITPKQTHRLTAGDALFVRKGVYTTKQYLENDYCVMLFFINDRFIKKFLEETPSLIKQQNDHIKYDQIFNIDTDDSFRTLIESIFNYLKQSVPIPKSLVEIKFKELLFNIVLNTKNKAVLNYFNSITLDAKLTIENTMTENFLHDLAIIDYAKLCGKSLSSFKREFKEYFNTTPGKWLMDKRIEHATNLLLGTDMTVSQIGYESGFKNSSHFSRSFKKKLNLSPNRYKALHIEV